MCWRPVPFPCPRAQKAASDQTLSTERHATISVVWRARVITVSIGHHLKTRASRDLLDQNRHGRRQGRSQYRHSGSLVTLTRRANHSQIQMNHRPEDDGRIDVHIGVTSPQDVTYAPPKSESRAISNEIIRAVVTTLSSYVASRLVVPAIYGRPYILYSAGDILWGLTHFKNHLWLNKIKKCINQQISCQHDGSGFTQGLCLGLWFIFRLCIRCILWSPLWWR